MMDVPRLVLILAAVATFATSKNIVGTSQGKVRSRLVVALLL